MRPILIKVVWPILHKHRSRTRQPNFLWHLGAGLRRESMALVPTDNEGAVIGKGAAEAAAAASSSWDVAREYKRARHRNLPTPSPLRRMADPVEQHILPSRKDKSRSLMPPPPPKPRRRPGAPPDTLDEDTFVEAMGEIIERDFFPELPRLQRQMKWLDALEQRRLGSMTEVRRVVQSELRRDPGEGRGGGESVAGGITPVMRGGARAARAGAATGGQTPLSYAQGEAVGGEEGTEALPLSLDQFLARFQSEDDASFDVLAEKMREAHKRKYWWVYSKHAAIEAGKEKLYLLPSGEFMTEEQQRKHVAASNAKPRLGDDRPNAPETWTYRPQNHLMFLPELQETTKIHQKHQGAIEGHEGPLLLENGGKIAGGGNQTAIVPSTMNARVGEAAKPPKEVVHNNTRFTVEFRKEAGLIMSPLERLATDMSSFSTDTSASTEHAATNDAFVPMTPLLIPGADGDVPIMTWGEVESTPLRVSEPFDAAEEAAAARNRFRIQGKSYREKVASDLEHKARQHSKTRNSNNSGGGGGATLKIYSSGSKTPAFSSSSSAMASSSSSKKRGLSSLTPAAQSLAAKLAGSLGSNNGDAFGGSLSASYSGLGTVRRSTTGGGGVGVAKRSSISTPSPSPMRISSSSAASAGAASSGSQQKCVKKISTEEQYKTNSSSSSSSSGKSTSSIGEGRGSLTGNLLNI